jgi:hypothetical protein
MALCQLDVKALVVGAHERLAAGRAVFDMWSIMKAGFKWVENGTVPNNFIAKPGSKINFFRSVTFGTTLKIRMPEDIINNIFEKTCYHLRL